MIFTTVHAIRKIKHTNCQNVLLNGKKSSILGAMIASLNYHTLKIIEDNQTLIVNGEKAVPFSNIK